MSLQLNDWMSKEDSSFTMSESASENAFSFMKHLTILVGLPLLSWCVPCKELSIAGGVVVATIYCWKLTFGKSRELKKQRERQQVQLLFKDEKSAIQQLFTEIPQGVFFPDIERVEWINKIACKLWPDIAGYVKDYIKNDLEEKIQKSLPSVLKGLTISRVDLGDEPPRITGVKAYDLVQDVVIIDMDIFYAGDMVVSITTHGVDAGVKDLELNGRIRLELKPLLGHPPFVGGFQMYFLTTPIVKFDLTDLGELLELPGINGLLLHVMETMLNSCIVLPNKVTVPFASREETPELRYDEPTSVLKVEVLEAKDLVTKDVFTKSDPYVIISVGAEQRKTDVVRDTSDPVWEDEVHFFPILAVEGMELQLQMFDRDSSSADEAMSRICLSLSSVAEQGYIDTWKDLGNGCGSMHFRLTWYQLKPQLPPAGSQPVAMLSVFVDSAKDLQRQQADEEPSSFVSVAVGADQKRSEAVNNTPNPIYDENFHFLLDSSFHLDNLRLTVREVESEQAYGEVEIRLSDVTEAEGMVVYRDHSLSGRAGVAKLFFRSSIKYLLPPANASSVAAKQETGNTVGRNEGGSAPTPPADDQGSKLRKRTTQKPFGEAGDIELTLTYDRQTLTILVLRCRNLPSSDSCEGKPPDPYVKLRLSSDRAKTYKTQIRDDSFNPTFDEKFNFDLPKTNLATESLEINVKHHGSAFRKVEMGNATVQLSNILPSKNVWFPLSRPDEEA